MIHITGRVSTHRSRKNVELPQREATVCWQEDTLVKDEVQTL